MAVAKGTLRNLLRRFAMYTSIRAISYTVFFAVVIGQLLVTRVPVVGEWFQQYQGIIWTTTAIICGGLLGWMTFNSRKTRRAHHLFISGVRLVRQQCYDEALSAFEQAISLIPMYADAWWNKGSCLNRLGRIEEALVANERALEIRPQFAIAWFSKGVYLSKLRYHQAAFVANDRALSINPEYASAWVNKGGAHARFKQFDEALDAFDHALRLDRKHDLAWNNKASVLSDDLKRYAEALQVCDDALAQGVSSPGIWSIKGDSLSALGRTDEARLAYQQVLNFPREDYLSWASSGSALAGLGRFEEALDAYEHAFTLKQDSPWLQRKKADVLRKLGRDDEALAAEKHAEELER